MIKRNKRELIKFAVWKTVLYREEKTHSHRLYKIALKMKCKTERKSKTSAEKCGFQNTILLQSKTMKTNDEMILCSSSDDL